MPNKRDLDPSVSPAHFFGAEVRREREARRMRQPELGMFTHCDGSLVSRIEGGQWPADPGFAKGCDEAFPERDGWFSRFYEGSLSWARTREWFRPWAAIEQVATVIRQFEPALMPGLLQTEDYARALLGSWVPNPDADVADRVERQAILTREDSPLQLWVVIGEPALHREIGDAGIMADQCAHLAEMASRPNVTLQVLPDITKAYIGWSGGFGIATAGTVDTAVYLESSVRPLTVQDPTMINEAVRVFTRLVSESQSAPLSRDMTLKAVERWNM
jgi:Domain of unknown function (DUF5753)